MITFGIVLVLSVLAFAGYTTALARLVRKDNVGGGVHRGEPPRSHPRDAFDTRRLF